MARPALIKGGYFTILMGDGATPAEVFTVLCGLNTRSFTIQTNTSDVFVADCALPEDVPARQVNLTGKQWDMSGAGLYNRTDATRIRAAVGVVKNYRFSELEPASPAVAVDSGWWAGAFVLTNWQQQAADGQYVTASMTFVSDGPVLWVPTV
ncbi:hypothetical protein D3Y57_19245 [Sphingomonas paeninsulae]|uniref:Phage tail protein n=1 Tax=Sphingomonas paeninsulae TaxID=2319844 RepID=A0A494TEH3_SPHPE|nr:phage tail tube protein [Sphingomonas paeninsulae]AYJ87670.1 hypothetical protein D3Y57_19245 [Sphingomonas paeninsulae]